MSEEPPDCGIGASGMSHPTVVAGLVRQHDAAHTALCLLTALKSLGQEFLAWTSVRGRVGRSALQKGAEAA